MIELRFTVHGVPIPKGSLKAFMPKNARFPIVTHDNTKTRPWQALVRDAALQARGGNVDGNIPTFEGPVWLSIEFYLPKPKSAPKRVRFPIKKPDLDKLVRSVKDGMTAAAVYQDDSQVVFLIARKQFAGKNGDPLGQAGIPRAEIKLRSFGTDVPQLERINPQAGLFADF